MTGDVRIEDRGFCHGTAGCYYIFNKLFKKYNLPEFEQPALYWLDKTVENPESNIETFYSKAIYKGKEKFAPDSGFICGYVGIGLALMCEPDESGNEWDEIFML
ncbi:lanthionine synthetase LanC family protein [Flavobacterium sp. 3HN19-14]|uniref:lanthionine synthetase LanC family protein n=1 Tax=Flavobacterium sp. 3HN19-14 TaxID=3448133 RepID=UPI003EE1FE61